MDRLKRGIKAGVALMLALTLAVGLTACGGKEDKQVSVSQIEEAVLEAMTKMPELSRVDSEGEDPEVMFSFICDFDYEKVDSYSFVYSAEGKADEIAVIKVKDEMDVEPLKLYLEDGNKQRRLQFEAYAPEELEKLDSAVVESSGKYVILIVGEQAELGKQAFLDCFK